MKRREAILRLGAGGLAVMGIPGLSRAQADFPPPGATIKYTVPFAAGGLTDVMARIVAQKLAENWKVPVIIENKGGGHAQIGADAVAKGPYDGLHILGITQAHAANVTLFPNAAFSFTKDLRPVALLADSPMLVVVPSNSPIKDFKDLMAVSKTKHLNGGSAGGGSAPHLTLELFNDLNQSKIAHVAYRGGAPLMNDLLGGHIDLSFSNYPPALPHVKSGKLRALAICSQTRHPDLPDVPTTGEAGMPGLLVENWTAVMAPARTPDAIVEKYSRELVKIMNTPEVIEKAQQAGFRVNAKGHDEFGRHLKAEIERWGRVIKTAKITIN
jgi:tripartite-type tricarboxylate transporter receptor subunit TctC